MENFQINTNSEIDLSLIILNLVCAFIISLKELNLFLNNPYF